MNSLYHAAREAKMAENRVRTAEKRPPYLTLHFLQHQDIQTDVLHPDRGIGETRPEGSGKGVSILGILLLHSASEFVEGAGQDGEGKLKAIFLHLIVHQYDT